MQDEPGQPAMHIHFHVTIESSVCVWDKSLEYVPHGSERGLRTDRFGLFLFLILYLSESCFTSTHV